MPSLELLIAPSGEPVTLAEIKAQARLDADAEDALLAALTIAARQWIEDYTGRALLPQSWLLWLDRWPELSSRQKWDALRGAALVLPCSDFITLPKPPLQSVDAVWIYQNDDSYQVWDAAAWRADSAAQPGRLVLRGGQGWPMPTRPVQGIGIYFTAGYANAAAVPEPIKTALKQLVVHWYEQRGEPAAGSLREAPYGVQALLNPYRIRSLA